MTSELIKAIIAATPSDFHTVAAICGAPDEGNSIAYISPQDVKDGNARVLGSHKNIDLSKGALPAMLLYETGASSGVLFAIWHRNHSLKEENLGLRVSVSERDKVIGLFNKVVTALKGSDIGFRSNISPSYSYENAYDAFALTMPFTWHPANCVNGQAPGTEVHYTPGLY